MTPEEINKLMAAAENALIEAFKAEMAAKGLTELLPYCHPHFDINFRQKIHTYQVSVLYEIQLAKNEYWEETPNGKRRVSVDEKTGEKGIIIGDSYEGRSIYKSQSPVQDMLNIDVLTPIDAGRLRQEAQSKPSFWASIFKRKSSKKLVVNEDWERMFRKHKGR